MKRFFLYRLFYIPAIILSGACAGPAQDNNSEEATAPSGTIPAAGTPTLSDSVGSPGAESVYRLIHKTDTVPGRIDIETIAELDDPLRALAAFYAAMGGTNCDGENCELTTALGLGKQGSDKHKALITNYFPDDPVAATVVGQDCYLRPSGASTFSDFEYLTITAEEDTVKVNYRLMQYNRGGVTHTEGPDVYLLKDSRFSKLQRNLWTHVE